MLFWNDSSKVISSTIVYVAEVARCKRINNSFAVECFSVISLQIAKKGNREIKSLVFCSFQFSTFYKIWRENFPSLRNYTQNSIQHAWPKQQIITQCTDLISFAPYLDLYDSLWYWGSFAWRLFSVINPWAMLSSPCIILNTKLCTAHTHVRPRFLSCG